jgi:hypothetical protein
LAFLSGSAVFANRRRVIPPIFCIIFCLGRESVIRGMRGVLSSRSNDYFVDVWRSKSDVEVLASSSSENQESCDLGDDLGHDPSDVDFLDLSPEDNAGKGEEERNNSSESDLEYDVSL